MPRVLAKGISINAADSNGNTALIEAAGSSTPAVVSYLLSLGADPNHQNKLGETALFAAAANQYHQDRLAVLEALLKAPNIDIHVVGNRATPLGVAASWAHLDVVKALIARGVDPNKASQQKMTPLMDAIMGEQKEQTPAVIDFLVKSGADVNAKGPKDFTVLHWAVKQHSYASREKTLIQLLSYKPDLESIESNYGFTPLQAAAFSGHASLVEIFLKHGAELEARTAVILDPKTNVPLAGGATLLMLAAYMDHEETVKLLLEKGADAKAKDVMGFTALDYVQRNDGIFIGTQRFKQYWLSQKPQIAAMIKEKMK